MVHRPVSESDILLIHRGTIPPTSVFITLKIVGLVSKKIIGFQICDTGADLSLDLLFWIVFELVLGLSES